jgi:hypothetical protein
LASASRRWALAKHVLHVTEFQAYREALLRRQLLAQRATQEVAGQFRLSMVGCQASLRKTSVPNG